MKVQQINAGGKRRGLMFIYLPPEAIEKLQLCKGDTLLVDLSNELDGKPCIALTKQAQQPGSK